MKLFASISSFIKHKLSGFQIFRPEARAGISGSADSISVDEQFAVEAGQLCPLDAIALVVGEHGTPQRTRTPECLALLSGST